MLVFMYFSVLAYFMYKALICFYTGALRELERNSFYKSETSYTTVCFWVEQGLMKYNPPIWCSKRNIRRKVLAEIYEHFQLKASFLCNLSSQPQGSFCRDKVALDDSNDSNGSYDTCVSMLKSIKNNPAMVRGSKGTPPIKDYLRF
jgi:hypothetical protein